MNCLFGLIIVCMLAAAWLPVVPPHPRWAWRRKGRAAGTESEAWKQARKLIVLVVGGSVMLLGVAMILLPGPAFVVIPAGLAILATEFVWARRLLRRVRQQATDLGRKLIGKGKDTTDSVSKDTPDDHNPRDDTKEPT